MDITKKLTAFYHHLNEDEVDRTILSVKLGDGKTEFLNKFKEKYSNQYAFYSLTPINYQLTANEQIIEYVKRDLLAQLVLDGSLNPSINVPAPILLQWYLNERPLDVIKDIMRYVPSVLRNGNELGALLKGAINMAEGITNQCKKLKGFKEYLEAAEFDKATKSVTKYSAEANNMTELDPLNWLITRCVAGKKKTTVLLIEDFDRIVPVHLFGIFNIFSAHSDKKLTRKDVVEFEYDSDNKAQFLNKFGFDKIIFIMDSVAMSTVFRNYYGDANYEGYIKEFVSKHIFYHSVSDHAKSSLQAYVKEECKVDFDIVTKGLSAVGIKLEKNDSRDVVKVLDNFEDAYIKEEVSVTDDFHFLSDTPLVKLIALLRRLGVRENQLLDFFTAIEVEDSFMELLGCFAVTKDSIQRHGKVCHNGVLYQMVVDEDEGKYKSFDRVMNIPSMVSVDDYRFLEVDINKVIGKALEYVR